MNETGTIAEIARLTRWAVDDFNAALAQLAKILRDARDNSE
jgi:hypothetical protein